MVKKPKILKIKKRVSKEEKFQIAKKEALKYNNKVEFKQYDEEIYKWLVKNTLMHLVTEHMIDHSIKRKKNNNNKISDYEINIALKKGKLYKNRTEFHKASPKYYRILLNKALLDDIFETNVNRPSKYTVESVKEVALKYETLEAFKREELSAYNFIIRNKIIKITCAHLKRKNCNYTEEMAKEVILSCNTLTQVMKKSYAAYTFLKKNNLLEKYSTHFTERYRWKYSDEEALEIALKYETRTDLAKGKPGVYGFIHSRNLKDKAFSHMKSGLGGFNPNKRGIVYYIRIDKDGDTVYKIGITNYDIERRFGKNQMKYITPIHEWKYENGANAYKLEQEILTDYSHLKYKGPDILTSGNTEMFIDDILMLDKEVA